MGLAFAEIELAALERRLVIWFVQQGAAVRRGEARKLLHEVNAARGDLPGEFCVMVSEVVKRGGRREFLALKEQRRCRGEQQQGRHRAVAAGARLQLAALPAAGVCDLVVVLSEDDE